MIDFLIHDANGRITLSARAPESMADIQEIPEGGGVLRKPCDIDRDYVSNGMVAPRPANTVRLDGTTLKNLPAAYTVEIDGKEYPGTSPTCDLTFEHAGTYDVTVKAFPMLDAIFTLTI